MCAENLTHLAAIEIFSNAVVWPSEMSRMNQFEREKREKERNAYVKCL